MTTKCALDSNIAETAFEIRKSWKDDESRRVFDPVGYVVASLVKSNIAEMKNCKDKAVDLLAAKKRANEAIAAMGEAQVAFLEALYITRKLMSWLYNEDVARDAGLSVTHVISALHKDPDSLYDAIHRAADEDLTRAVMQGKNYACVLCGTKVE